MFVTISAYKRCPVRLYLHLFVGVLMTYLRYLCLLPHSGFHHILSCVFDLFVLCDLCCRFLWIVHFSVALSVFSGVYLISRTHKYKTGYFSSLAQTLQ